MSDRFTFNSAGQVHELEMAMDRAGDWSAALVKRLCEEDRLTKVRDYLLGLAEIRYPEHIIDCDAVPFVPKNWEVEHHQKGGQFKFDPTKVLFYLSESQSSGGVIKGHELRKEMADKPVLNANVLDYLIVNPHLIPEEWKLDEQGRTRYIFFWGTIYRDSDGDLYVRYLSFEDSGWDWGYRWLDGGWRGASPAALLASIPAGAQAQAG